ncbi:Uncharacterised protein [Enterobacter ludwigii]|nr:Uncharacterised protein [Enterobacter ludwigii]SAH43307.1 Uncharacterised protein [Enterobacter ludwigii]
MVDFNFIHIDLKASLNLIAAIDKQQGCVFQYQRQTCGAIKARQPGQLFIVRRAILTLPGIRARHDHAIKIVFL